MFWTSVAVASTLTVGQGQAYPTVSAAVAASTWGDVVEIHSGTYAESVYVTHALSFVGVGDPVLRPAAPGFFSYTILTLTDLAVSGLEIDAQGGYGILVAPPNWGDTATLDVSGVFLHGASWGLLLDLDSYGSPAYGDFTITDSRFESNLVAVDNGTGGWTSATDSWFVDNSIGLDVGDGDFVRNTFVRNGNSLYLQLGSQSITDNVFCRGQAVYGYVYDPSAGTVSVRNNRFALNQGGPAIQVSDSGLPAPTLTLSDNTFVEAGGPGGGALWSSGIDVNVTNNLFVGSKPASPALRVTSGGVLTGDYNLFFANRGGDLDPGHTAAEVGLNTLWGVDPGFVAYSQDDRCNDDLRLAPGSPAIDSGNPAWRDRDQSRSDMGWNP